MNELRMAVRAVDTSERMIVGVAAPYGEVSELAGDPAGERIMAGTFRRSIEHRADRIPLLANHGRDRVLGYSVGFDDGADGLVGRFRINEGADGDRALEDVQHGYYAGMSVGYVELKVGRGADGVREVREGKLVEVSLVGIPAYEGAAVLAVRNAQDVDALLAPFRNRPDVNLAPIPPLAYRSIRN